MMKNYRSMNVLAVIMVLSFVVLPRFAYAYIDPGTGSYVIQVLIAGFVAASFATKVYWTKVKMFFRNLFSKDRKHESGKDQ